MTELLTDEERKQVAAARHLRATGKALHGFADDLLAIIDRLSAEAGDTDG
jgi:hypothetical protein